MISDELRRQVWSALTHPHLMGRPSKQIPLRQLLRACQNIELACEDVEVGDITPAEFVRKTNSQIRHAGDAIRLSRVDPTSASDGDEAASQSSPTDDSDDGSVSTFEHSPGVRANSRSSAERGNSLGSVVPARGNTRARRSSLLGLSG